VLGSELGAGAGIFKDNRPTGKGFAFEKRKSALWKAQRKKRNAFADEDGDHAEVELVAEEIAGKFTTAHVPNLFATCLRRHWTNRFGESLVKVTPLRSPGETVREKTQHAKPWLSNLPRLMRSPAS